MDTGSNSPVPATRPPFHSSSKSRVNAVASSGDPTTASTFSSRVHESSVQLVEPVHTDAPSRTTYLWCIRSGTPGIALAGMPAAANVPGSVRGGGGTGMGLRSSSLYTTRMATPRSIARFIEPKTVGSVAAPRLRS